MAIGMVVGPLYMFIIFTLHRLHVFLLGECALSKLQRRLGGLPSDQNFLQYTAQKLFGQQWSIRKCRLVDLSIVLVSFALAFFH
jgi:hypothetical protein